jgi:hypothetical protein
MAGGQQKALLLQRQFNERAARRGQAAIPRNKPCVETFRLASGARFL